MRILILQAGTNHPSNSETLAAAFTDGIRSAAPDTQIDTIRIEDLDLAHFTLAHYDAATDQGPGYAKMKDMILAANGVVIATPIWNFSVPAHLKNLLDRMGAFGLDAEFRSKGTLKGKPFFFLFTGGAPLPAWKGLMRFTTMHVKEAIRYFGGSIFGTHFEGKCTTGRGKFGLILNQRPENLAKAKAKGEKFARRVTRFAADGTLPRSIRIITWFYLKGQRVLAKF